MTYDGPQPANSGPSSNPSNAVSSTALPVSQAAPIPHLLPHTPAPSTSPSPLALITASHTNSTTASLSGTPGGTQEIEPRTDSQNSIPTSGRVSNLEILTEPGMQTSKEQTQAFYHSSVNLTKPLQIPTAPPARQHGQLPTPPMTLGDGPSSSAQAPRTIKALPPVPIPVKKVDLKQKQPIRGARVLPEPYQNYTSITEDESLHAMPQRWETSSETFSGLTEDNVMISSSHWKLTPAQAIAQSSRSKLPQIPTPIDVASIQTSSAQSSNSIGPYGVRNSQKERTRTPARIETKLTRRNTVASSPTSEIAPRLVVQQPKPVKAFNGLPVSLNLQVQVAQSDCESMYAVEDPETNGKQTQAAKSKKSFGLGGNVSRSRTMFGTRSRDANVTCEEEHDSRVDESFVMVNTP